MIDDFALGLTHFLMALAIWRLLSRADIDTEPVARPDVSPDDVTTLRPGRRKMRLSRD